MQLWIDGELLEIGGILERSKHLAVQFMFKINLTLHSIGKPDVENEVVNICCFD